MRKITLFAGLVVASMGLATVATTSSAFAACLNPDAGTIDLSHNAMQTNAGPGYDMNAYNNEIAKGNVCPTTEQSVSPDQLSDYKPIRNNKPAVESPDTNNN